MHNLLPSRINPDFEVIQMSHPSCANIHSILLLIEVQNCGIPLVPLLSHLVLGNPPGVLALDLELGDPMELGFEEALR